MAENPARPPLDWSGNAPFPFTRESSIRIDDEGRFWHDGQLVEHPKLATAMATWISRHPNDGRYILENGYDWCWITVDDAPLSVRSARIDGDAMVATLSDGTDERIDPSTLMVDDGGNVRCKVHHDKNYGPYDAKFDRHALQALGERLREENGGFVLALDGGRSVRLGSMRDAAR